MRSLLIICAIFVIANVGLYLWPTSANTAAHIYAPQADINPHFIRLNKEVEDRFYAAQPYDGEIVAGSDIQFTADVCYRLGPFLHQANYDLAQAVLFNANVEYRKSTKESKSSNVYRVYIGPYITKAETDDARVDLKRKKVLDHFARQEADSSFIISLGIYTTQESANRAVELFNGKLDSVKLKEEVVVLPNTSWLYFSIEGNDQIRQQLARMDWGERAAKLGKFDCQSI